MLLKRVHIAGKPSLAFLGGSASMTKSWYSRSGAANPAQAFQESLIFNPSCHRDLSHIQLDRVTTLLLKSINSSPVSVGGKPSRLAWP